MCLCLVVILGVERVDGEDEVFRQIATRSPVLGLCPRFLPGLRAEVAGPARRGDATEHGCTGVVGRAQHLHRGQTRALDRGIEFRKPPSRQLPFVRGVERLMFLQEDTSAQRGYRRVRLENPVAAVALEGTEDLALARSQESIHQRQIPARLPDASDANEVTRAHVLSLQLFAVVKRGSGHGHAPDHHRP